MGAQIITDQGRGKWFCHLGGLLASVMALLAPAVAAQPLGPRDIAVVVNVRDADSVRTGRYFQRRRGLPAENFIRVSFDPGDPVLKPREFAAIKARLDELTPPAVQGYALAWSKVTRVGCMSITTAVAAGYDPAFCARGCEPTRESPLFNSRSHRPYDDFRWRPAMLLPAEDFHLARDLVERGIAADATFPFGGAYLLRTSDKRRNVRATEYARVAELFGDLLKVRVLEQDAIRDREDVLFYFTGSKWVRDIDSNRFLPGALADHLTSAGGRLEGGRQMSALAWIRAGATGSYGTVVEPCNFPPKFPSPLVAMDRYLDGDTLLEAYWKSVAWPGQGIFIGEPLARPFSRPPDTAP